MYLCTTIYIEKFVFLYFTKCKVFFNTTFLITLLMCISIYIFNVIIFKNKKI
jgi:hypothetical protein